MQYVRANLDLQLFIFLKIIHQSEELADRGLQVGAAHGPVPPDFRRALQGGGACTHMHQVLEGDLEVLPSRIVENQETDENLEKKKNLDLRQRGA